VSKIVDVTGGQGGKAFLLLGEQTALIDCGMAYCAPNLIHNMKQVLHNKRLDYIVISHSHYDHIGAIPYLKQEWPSSRVLGAEHAQQVLNRPNALKTIRNFSRQAAKLFAVRDLQEYDDAMLKVDEVICDGDILDLGGLCIKVIATKGHTNCSLSFLINNETLFASESTGVMNKSGRILPGFITSCAEAIASIQLCQEINPRFIISPHLGLVNENYRPDYWTKCSLAVQETTEFILDLAEQGYAEEQILSKYETMFRDEQNRAEQPINAFRLNAQSMIRRLLSKQ
jgi:glyoxylase-like metal-dependent hydrolase (beta-lactamase superfamily II)